MSVKHFLAFSMWAEGLWFGACLRLAWLLLVSQVLDWGSSSIPAGLHSPAINAQRNTVAGLGLLLSDYWLGHGEESSGIHGKGGGGDR